jgi:LPXTG-motif cell wall-anchored protein
MTRAAIRLVFSSALVCLATVVTMAQSQTSTTAETKNFKIIAVDGNQLVVSLPEGTRELTVPADFQFNVDGRNLTVSELKPGMQGTATITTTTTVTPVNVTEVKNGTVMQATGSSITVRTDEGIKMFTQGDIDKRGVKIMRDGKPAGVADFRVGDRLSATIITSMPPRVVSEREVQATLARPAAPAPAPAPAATAGAAPAPAAAPTTGLVVEEVELPATASPLPVVGLAGLVSLAAGLALTLRRRRATR